MIGQSRRDRLIAFFMLLPSLILLGIFVYGFIGSTLATSLTDSSAMQRLMGAPANNVGFKNYIDLFTSLLDSRFRTDVVNTVFFTTLFIAVCLAIGMLLAILLDQKIRGEGIFRTIFLFPMALSFVVTGVVWKWLFNPDAGINALPTAIGLPKGNFRWFISEEQWLQFNWQDLPVIVGYVVLAIVLIWALLRWSRTRGAAPALVAAGAILAALYLTFGDAGALRFPNREVKGFNVALIAVVVAAGWQMVGYTMAMYLAGLRGISEELREAARVDGCTEWGVYRHVVFPLLAPITLSAMIILGHISLKIFDLVYVLGGGDNLYIDMPGLNMFFETFRGQQFGRGAAIAMVMLVMVAVVIIPYLVSSLRSQEKNA